jgi:ATP-dependent 26S proteasome regulatory subunit
MPTTEELGIALAEDVLKAVDEIGDDAIINEVNKIVEASSSGLQEAYMAAIRAQRASVRARDHLNAKLKGFRTTKASQTAPTGE